MEEKQWDCACGQLELQQLQCVSHSRLLTPAAPHTTFANPSCAITPITGEYMHASYVMLWGSNMTHGK